MLQGQNNYTGNFTPFAGLFWLVLVVTIGSRTVEGAIQAGLAFALLPQLFQQFGIPLEYQYILFGLGALTYARNPEGILEAAKRTQLAAIQRALDRRKRHAGAGADPGRGNGPPTVPEPAVAATPKQARS